MAGSSRHPRRTLRLGSRKHLHPQAPFFDTLDRSAEAHPPTSITGARPLVIVGDSVTTDHISPAGDIAEASPAGSFLKDRGIVKKDFNSYGSRRGNDLVMVRGTFANVRLKNIMVAPKEGNLTRHHPSGEDMPIFDASTRYKAAGTPLVVIAGKDYGKGSSRDWARRASSCSVSRPSSPRVTNASTGPTLSAWGSSHCSSRVVKVRSRSD